jgi:type I restriction enzyme S subunit
MEPISQLEKSELEEQFEESDLPFTVDIIDWDSISAAFKQHIQHDLVTIKRKTSLSCEKLRIISHTDSDK